MAIAVTGIQLARNSTSQPDAQRILGWTVGGTLVFVSFAALTLFGENVAVPARRGPSRRRTDSCSV